MNATEDITKEMSNESSHYIKVILADDHELFLTGVESSLSKHRNILIIGKAANGQELLQLLKNISPDVILLDIHMPVMDGYSVLPEIKKLYPKIKVIILSMNNDPSIIRKMLEAGANAYLTKESESETIYEAIQSCLENGFFLNNLISEAIFENKRVSRPQTQPTNIKLNEKEITILKLMSEEKGLKEIADIVDLSPRTVEAIRDKLKIKTGVKSMAGLMMYAVKSGIVEEPVARVESMDLNLSKQEIAKLASISTSILAYINHDLGGQRTKIHIALQKVREILSEGNKEIPEEVDFLLNKAFDAVKSLTHISALIKSSFYLTRKSANEEEALESIYVSDVTEILQKIKDRFQDVSLEIDPKETLLNIVYPPNTLYYILSELVENARKNSRAKLKMLFRWQIVDKVFKCEMHDNGPGFEIKTRNKLVPLDIIKSNFDPDKFGGLGLTTINRTIIDSDGHLFFGSSNDLKGALVYFEFPLIDFKIREA